MIYRKLKMAQPAQTDLGNTMPNPARKRYRAYCFTLNNYNENDIKHIIDKFGTKAQYILAKEKGENGTPHIQGYVKFKNPKDFNAIKKIMPRAHIEQAKGTIKDNWTYCSKEGNYETNIDLRSFKDKLKDMCLVRYNDIKWKDWQQEVLDLKNDERTIHWYYEETGNVGKTFLCKYMALTRNIILCEGKKNDIFNQVNMMIEKELMPEIVICDIPRTSYEYINYGAIEQLKNGLLYSGKYEGGLCVFPPPLVICFANKRPDVFALSEDRWNIVEIN